MQQPSYRFLSIARQDWEKDVGLLREMVESDADAMQVVKEGVDDLSWYSQLTSSVMALFKGGQVENSLIERLAGRQDLIHRVLDVKDWSQSPHRAAQLLGLVPDRLGRDVSTTMTSGVIAARD